MMNKCSAKNAIILAAGVGMRMVPINTQYPKGLIEVNGEKIIERIISQLHEAGITEIHVVVGFLKEKYEYLMDNYDVNLIVNREYSVKNNMHSLFLASKYLSNTYIIPSDIYCKNNPFLDSPDYSWYMVTNTTGKNSNVQLTSDNELLYCKQKRKCNKMIGIAYLENEVSKKVKENLKELNGQAEFDSAFWEDALFENDKMLAKAFVVNVEDTVEIDTYEQLRELDHHSNQLKNDAIDIICETLNVGPTDISDIRVLKKGMTNRSFYFCCNNIKYIMRIPGEGTDQLINRKEEAAVYGVINPYQIADNVLYMNPDNGYKITEFIPNVRVCDSESKSDLKACMDYLRDFHNRKLKVNHFFDLFEKIDFYESLWGGKASLYSDYGKTKANVFKLRKFIDSLEKEYSLIHIDAVPDNFLMYTKEGEQHIKLIDWEYSSMQDPHVDIAMFCIYSLYHRPQVDELIDIYFEGKCDPVVRIKIYAYIAICGLLWSNWCEYKAQLGVEFGEYSLRQYRYAKEYYKIVVKELGDAYEL